jgi:hypothetical protein
MTPLVYTVKQAVEMLGGPDVVTEYWIKKTARKLGIGTRFGRTLCFTEEQVRQLIDAHALKAQQPKPQRQERAKKQSQSTPKAKASLAPIPAASGNVTRLQSRPERARSYGSAS